MKFLERINQWIARVIERIISFRPVFSRQARLYPGLHSLKFEISMLYTFVLGMILIIFSGVIYGILFFTLNKDLDHELKWKAQEISQSIRAYLDIQGNDRKAFLYAIEKTITGKGKEPSQWWPRMHEGRWLKRLKRLDFSENYVNFSSPAAVSLVKSKNLDDKLLSDFRKTIQPFKKGKEEVFHNISYDHQQIRLLNFAFTYKGWPRYTIQVGAPQRPATQLLQSWLHSMLIGVPAILLLTVFVGRILAIRALDPVQKITAAARKISSEDLSARVQAKYYDAQMQGLAQAFNDMISRLEKSFNHIEAFSSHAAHELKTPLAIIKGESELALRKDRDLKEYKRVLRVNVQESERMLRTIEDLLLLAKLDYQPEIFKFESIDFLEFMKEIYEQFCIFASSKKITIDLSLSDESIVVNADKLHLRRLFFNLLDNALKFTPAEGKIAIRIIARNQNVIAAISDTGPGISSDKLGKIFDRFFRADTRSPGSGLGLNIAQVIAKIHHGEIRVKSKLQEGSTFEVILPCFPS